MRANSGGSENVAVGAGALSGDDSPSKSVAIGAGALSSSLSAVGNIAIGYNAGSQLVTGQGNVYISNVGAPVEDGTIRIGGLMQTRTFISGIMATPVMGAAVAVDTTIGQLGFVASSGRYKEDITTVDDGKSRVLSLRPVSYHYKFDPSAQKHYGLIAEEVAEVYPELVARDAHGDVQTVLYHELVPLLLDQLQRQRHALDEQARERTSVVARMDGYLTELRELRRKVDLLMGSLAGGPASGSRPDE